MREEIRVYNFGKYATSSEEIAEIFFYLKQMEAQCSFSSEETAASLVERQMAVSGGASRVKASLEQFMKKEYRVSAGERDGSYAQRIISVLDEVKKNTFYLREAALQLPAEKLKDNLCRAMKLIERLPEMVAALDAGGDEAK